MKRQHYSFNDTRSLVRYSLNFAHGKALDLGAGSAKYKTIIQAECSDYTAVDIHSGVNIDVVSDIIKTPFLNNSFDTVYCLQVFEHIPKPWLATKEINRLLKSEGVCILSAPFLQASHADPDDYFRYTVSGLESFFDESEFEILESGTYGGMYSLSFDFIRMLFFNVYEKPRRYTWRLVRLLVALGNMLDRLCSNKIIYMNSYIIVRKNNTIQ